MAENLGISAMASSACDSLTLTAGCSTKARVRKGMTLANFEIRIPRFGGLTELSSKCIGNPVSLRPKLTEEGRSRREDLYSCTFSVSHDLNFYPFQMKNVYDPKSTMAKFVKNFNSSMQRCERYYVAVAEFPRLNLHLNDDNLSQRLELSLPPRTALYTSFLPLFPELGFLIDHMVMDDNHVIGGRGTSRTTKPVYGFYNGSDRHMFYSNVIPTFEEDSPRSLWDAVHQGDDRKLAHNVQFQVEIGNWIDKELKTQQMLSFSREDLVLGLDSMFEIARERMNFAVNMMSVTTSGPPEQANITISNRALRTLKEMVDPETSNYISRVTFDFNPELKRVLGMRPGDKLTFTTDQERSYTFQIRDSVMDPFDSKYPVTMIAKGQGTAINYMEGLGYVALFGVMTQDSVKRHMTPIASDGFVFNSADQTNLAVEFYDRSMQLVKFNEDYELHLLIKFRRCF